MPTCMVRIAPPSSRGSSFWDFASGARDEAGGGGVEAEADGTDLCASNAEKPPSRSFAGRSFSGFLNGARKECGPWIRG